MVSGNFPFFSLIYAIAGPDLLIPNEYWLPSEVVPVHYDLKLVVHMDNLRDNTKLRQWKGTQREPFIGTVGAL